VNTQPHALCLFTLATRQCSPQLRTALYYNLIICTVCCSQKIIMTLVYNKPISLKSCFLLEYFCSLKYLFSSKSYMASSKRVKRFSYINMCGAPAPRTSLPKTPSNNSRGKKVAKFTSSDRLLFTTAGDRLPSIVVSGLILFLFLSLMNYSVVRWMP
jgi:hypothetical protein